MPGAEQQPYATTAEAPPPWPGGPAAEPSRQATAAMVCGIISAVLLITVYGMALSVLLGPVALGLGVAARRKVRRGESGGGGYALAGVVLGAVSFVVSAVVVVLVVLAMTVRDHPDPDHGPDSGGGDQVQTAPFDGRSAWSGARAGGG